MATKLVSMKVTKEEIAAKRKAYETAAPVDGDAYPYGLQVRLDTDALDKLGIDVSDYAAGDVVMLIAECEICETGARESIVGGDSQNLTLQITKMRIEDLPDKKPDTKDAASTLYNG